MCCGRITWRSNRGKGCPGTSQASTPGAFGGAYGPMSMGQEQGLLDMRALLESRYDTVNLLGSGRGKFVRVCKHRGCAVVSYDEEGWLLELWSVNDVNGEETLVAEDVVQWNEDALNRIFSWLNG